MGSLQTPSVEVSLEQGGPDPMSSILVWRLSDDTDAGRNLVTVEAEVG